MKLIYKINLLIRFPVFLLWAFLCTLFFCLIAPLFYKNPNLFHYFSRTNGWVGLKILGIKVHIKNPEGLSKHQPCLFMGNHRSNMDLMTYGAICPRRTIGIGKKELLYYPFIGFFLHCAGLLLIDRSNKEKAIQSLKMISAKLISKQMSVGIMPEGTRNKTDAKLLPFKKGPFHLAVQSGLPMVPVICSPIHINFDWKNKSLYGGTLHFNVLEPITTQGLKIDDIESLKSKTREIMLRAYLDLESKCSEIPDDD